MECEKKKKKQKKQRKERGGTNHAVLFRRRGLKFHPPHPIPWRSWENIGYLFYGDRNTLMGIKKNE
jgi:hypothetical protein